MKRIIQKMPQGNYTKQIQQRSPTGSLRRLRGRLLALVSASVVCTTLVPTATGAPPPQWYLYDLGTLGGSTSWACALSGNNSTDPDVKAAVIVGGSYSAGGVARPFQFSAGVGTDFTLDGSMSALSTSGFSWGEALGISPGGFTIVGRYQDIYSNWWPFYWTNSSTTLVTLDSDTGPTIGAFGVNDDGYVVGTEFHGDDPGAYQATYWNVSDPFDPDAPYNMLAYGPTDPYNQASAAYAINSSGIAVGETETEDLGNRAFRVGPDQSYYLPSATLLDPLSGKSNSEALGVNDSGDTVGDSDAYATLWEASSSTASQLYSSTSGQCQANAINNNGVVVGHRASGSSTVAVIWLDSTTCTDLLSLSGLSIVGGGTWSTLSTATAINDENWIVGWGTKNGAKHAFLLVWNWTNNRPVNE